MRLLRTTLLVALGWTVLAAAGAADQPDPTAAPSPAAPASAANPATPLATAPAAPPAGGARYAKAFVIPVEGDLFDVLTASLRRRVDQAVAAGADLIVIHLNTPGGGVFVCTEALHHLARLREKVHLAIYVDKQALSGGTLISLGAHDILMSETARLGDCEPIMLTGEGIITGPEKIQTAIRADFRQFAQLNGYPVALAEAMVTKGEPVYAAAWWEPAGAPLDSLAAARAALAARIPGALPARVRWSTGEAGSRRLGSAPGGEVRVGLDDKIVDQAGLAALAEAGPPPGTTFQVLERQEGYLREGELLNREGLIESLGAKPVVGREQLLTMSGSEALQLGFARALAPDLAGALAHYGVAPGQEQTIAMTWAENTAILLEKIPGGLLVMIGLIALYTEMKMPGVGLPGLIAVLAFGILFGRSYLADLTVGFEIVLFALGVALLLVEIFLIPGFGLVGITGLVLMFAGLVLSLTPAWPSAPSLGGLWWSELGASAGTIGLALAGMIVAAVALARFLPGMPLFNRVILAEAAAAQALRASGTAERETRKLLGAAGVALSPLRPSGQARFGDEVVSVVADGDFLEQDTPLRVTAVEGNRIVVERRSAT